MLQGLTGNREVSAQPLLRFFAPLESYLDELIAGQNIQVGWKEWDIPSKKDIFPRYKPGKDQSRGGTGVFHSNLLLITFLQLITFTFLQL